MSYHLTNLGQAAIHVSRFADLDGYIPEPGDSHADMRWDSMVEWDDDSWDAFVSEAAEATKVAEREIDAWRNA